MRIGIPRESLPGEQRVAATPKTVPQLIKLGYSVVVEQGAGERASYLDDEYEAAGAGLVDTETVWASDVVMAVNEPSVEELGMMRPGATLITFLHPRANPDLVEALQKAGVTGLSMDMVPRISRAQAMDALSSTASIAGYRAVVESAYAYGKTFAGQVTAAGKTAPAKVLVVGTGVAGLAAVGAAKSMGAEVFATDVRPETAEQVESMGGTFLHVRAAADDQGVSADGYAKETSEDYNKRAAELYAEQCEKVDIIILTAAIPGKPSPKLITADMVASMKSGSVIVDMAALGGGNCVLTRPGEEYTTDNGIHIIGYTDMASRLPAQASQMYAMNMVNLARLATPGKDGLLVIDFDDEVLRNMTVTRDGEITFPPPPIQVSAAPAASAGQAGPEPEPEKPKKERPWWFLLLVVGLLSVVLIALLTFAPGSFVSLFGTFALACVVGYYVVWNVSHALHTPLMSVTNAISGIIIVGALMQLPKDNMAITIIAALGVLVASINIFGGFSVTRRMLNMFRKGDR
ncbi:Re/Si-specific NAD(P)(+) transhydrogenase subunit alpha [Propionibacterium australiense]|nr:Re/Si-specific NAD(P)(+) transhydrogenase subunit alpha [Propionibacterium australiense]RLP07141.1 Re/Si-specific NAD(P)(+) transhydrogenase subunit alpha [Propionibacterium australiense]RLP07909.1 Re/Si-specific NAD(P)(+) transhydrogenase subunit alpha [Propionibacterium australiense]